MSLVIAVLALIVSASVAYSQLTDRRRAQADLVAGWVTVDRDDQVVKAVIYNGSSQPIYDVLYVVRAEDDLDAIGPALIPVIPPGGEFSVAEFKYEGGDESALSRRPYITFRRQSPSVAAGHPRPPVTPAVGQASSRQFPESGSRHRQDHPGPRVIKRPMQANQ